MHTATRKMLTSDLKLHTAINKMSTVTVRSAQSLIRYIDK